MDVYINATLLGVSFPFSFDDCTPTTGQLFEDGDSVAVSFQSLAAAVFGRRSIYARAAGHAIRSSDGLRRLRRGSARGRVHHEPDRAEKSLEMERQVGQGYSNSDDWPLCTHCNPFLGEHAMNGI
jgi:hypothetical protein